MGQANAGRDEVKLMMKHDSESVGSSDQVTSALPLDYCAALYSGYMDLSLIKNPQNCFILDAKQPVNIDR